MKLHTISVSDDVYAYLKDMIDTEHAQNMDMSEEHNETGDTVAHRPTFSEVVSHLIEDRDEAGFAGGSSSTKKNPGPI
jgi:predicted CopG family antitoxin